MPLFMMFGKYSSKALKGISPARTDKAITLIKKQGGEINLCMLCSENMILSVS